MTCAPRAPQVRFQSLTDKSVLEAEPELFIHMQPDKTNNTLTLRDSGVGMTKADLVNNLGARCARRALRAPHAALLGSAGAAPAAMHEVNAAWGSAYLLPRSMCLGQGPCGCHMMRADAQICSSPAPTRPKACTL